MLVGRESLVRLVGKRKRDLSSPAATSLLHYGRPASPSALPAVDGAGDAATPAIRTAPAVQIEFDCKVSDGGEAASCGWVKCPVCDRSIIGSDYAMNSHLDLCLSSGSKRKASQRTLLQLNFFSKKNNKSSSRDSDEHCKYIREYGMDANNEDKKLSSFAPEMASDHSCKVNSYLDDSVTYSQKSIEICNHDHTKKRTNDDATSGKKDDIVSMIPGVCCLSNSNIDNMDKWSITYDGETRVLETVIVGHRFYNIVDLWPGASISIVREPENSFDHHAIKVLYAVPGNEQTVGHLPQQLAKYLSPLIDDHGLKIEGFVTSIPTHPHDEFRVDLVCHQTMNYSQMKGGDIQVFESLWENSIRIVECENFRPNRMKYQQNFLLMIREVRDRYFQLFTGEETSFLDSFGVLSDDSQRLFVRLYTRKGPWFRMCNVSYAEVVDSKRAIEELQSARYVYTFQYLQNSGKSNLREVTSTLTMFELREISKLMLLKKGLNSYKKDDLIDCLCAAYEEGTCPQLPRMVSEMAGSCVKISSIADSLLWRIQRLFFLNGEQDLSAFLLVDLGLVKYPTYVCNISQPIFHDRSDFIGYEEAIEVAQIMDESLEENNIGRVNRCIELANQRLSPAFRETNQKLFLYRFSSLWVYSKVVTLGVSFLESEKMYEEAVKLLRCLLENCRLDRKRGYWTLRLSLDLEHLGLANESLSVAEEGLLDPRVRAGSRLALQKRVLRLGKPPRRWKVPDFAAVVRRKIPQVNVRGRPLNCKTGAKNRYYGYDGEQCSVEQLALQFYAEEGGGWRGVHSESGIWLTIFGLLMWDALFADVPDVFRTPFQTAPLDLESDDFFSSRKDLIESRLRKIREGMAEEILIISWESHLDTACRGVSWERHELSDLRAAVSCVGGRSLAAICRLLASDYRTWSSGMPDLLLWRFPGEEDGGPGEAKLAEVKGPRDQLSEQQRAWMLFLLDNDVDAEICRVSPR